MFPSKYQPNPLGGSGEEDFLIFTIYGSGELKIVYRVFS